MLLRRFFLACGVVFLIGAVAPADELPFPLNERLEYHISWNGIRVAWSVSTTGMFEENGTNYVAVRVETRTYPVFDVFYKVDDLHECLLDPETLKPVRLTKLMREGQSRYHDVTTFDYPNGTARFDNLEKGTSTNVLIGSNTRDYLSFMYFMRGQTIAPNSVSAHSVLADDKVYEVLVHAEKVENIGLSHYPDVPSLRIEPEAAFNGLFVRSGKATLWVSRDVRHLLTCLKAWVPFGRVTARLHDVSGGGDDFWIKEKQNGDDENEK